MSWVRRVVELSEQGREGLGDGEWTNGSYSG